MIEPMDVNVATAGGRAIFYRIYPCEPCLYDFVGFVLIRYDGGLE